MELNAIEVNYYTNICHTAIIEHGTFEHFGSR